MVYCSVVPCSTVVCVCVCVGGGAVPWDIANICVIMVCCVTDEHADVVWLVFCVVLVSWYW